VADLFASFETGYERPSLDNPLLFSRYADEIAMRLGHEYPAHTGYRIRVEKREKDPRKREWRVDLQRGWFSGARVKIKPLSAKPHRARVKVEWHSRLLEVLERVFAYISIVPLILLFVIFTLATRLGFALILTVVVAVAWGIAGSIVMIIVARLLAAIFGNEFTSETRTALATKIEQFPLPQSVPASTA
jgi:hypothetical protein